MIKATHVRKARRRGTCPLCRCLITVGQQVARVGRTGSWVHVNCLIEEARRIT